MQSMPLLLRHSLRSGIINLSRAPRPTRPLLFPAASPKALPVASRDARRSFSVCLQCRFRTQNSLYASHETDNLKDGKPAEQTDPSSAENPKPESEQPSSSTPTEETENVYSQGQTKETNQNVDGSPQGGGLPSYLEGRRSQFSKQFTDMMDNLQSNVFVAGQRLNDLTGYSSIEALKNEIHAQEERLRSARLQVRAAKDAYAAAINRRSTSQREVNELLQRKHAWSPADLERFTHLYRNDHTNEVAENEAQEKLSGAEREAEEASAALSKSILSRYHEEQVWSDKIRRMSTWGTWGLMGVNVLLFLIFQIAVEPWRRKRLVKGFEEKVIEAIEKEKTMNHVQVLGPDVQSATPREVADATQSDDTMASSPPPSSATPATTTTTSTSSTQKTSDGDSSTLPTQQQQQQPPAAEPNEPTPPNNVLSQLSRISPPPETVDSWRQYFHDLFSERSLVITQRDLSTVALQSAAAGAAVMGLVIALIRPR